MMEIPRPREQAGAGSGGQQGEQLRLSANSWQLSPAAHRSEKCRMLAHVQLSVKYGKSKNSLSSALGINTVLSVSFNSTLRVTRKGVTIATEK